MKTTELLDVEQALQLIERVLVSGGDEGQFLVSQIGRSTDHDRSLAQQQLATHKSLSSAKNLLTVALGLMDEPARLSSGEGTLQIKAAIEKLKVAARGAYEAGHLLVGVRRESG